MVDKGLTTLVQPRQYVDMDIPQNLTPAQESAANVAALWTNDSACLARLTCLHCFADAEQSAEENGAVGGEIEAWAAQYLSQGDSLGCWQHRGE